MSSASTRAADTRSRLLEAAGEVFAEHGFRTATVQEICRRADANIAAVNYHFSDKEQLYREVIRYAEEQHGAAHPRALAASASAEERLHAHVEWFLLHLLDEGRPAWHGRLMAREMIEPTAALDELVDGHIRESNDRLLGIVRELMGAAATDEQVRTSAFSITGQCLFYRHCEPVIARLHPDVRIGRAQVPALAEHVTRFSLAGLAAIASSAKPSRRTASARRRNGRVRRAAARKGHDS
ncbi:CerR family C-terminal domain-containing protein [Candidatus Binatia bacterium]|jgi:AcrR family transcriptional regulator|nr:CerR family C-terminal domain-containing protein [Candidatus Binatia bacterium]